MSARSRNKGKVGEREFAAFLRDRGIEARRGVQYEGGPGSPDVVCSLPGVHWEVKRVEALRLWDSLEQATSEAGAGDVPVVAHRANRRPWVVVLRADDFLRLVGEARDANTLDPAHVYAPDLEAALLDALAELVRLDASESAAARSALAVLDEIQDARCGAGLCGHDAGDEGCRATEDEDGHDALIVQAEGP